MALTELEVKNSKSKEKAFRLPDDKGLYLDIRPTGKRIWRIRYKIKGKENTLTFGEYPLISLKEARQKRDDARQLLISNIDPAAQRELEMKESSAPTFRDIALEFIVMKQKASSSAKARYAFEMRVRKYILPYLGN